MIAIPLLAILALISLPLALFCGIPEMCIAGIIAICTDSKNNKDTNYESEDEEENL